MATTIDQIAEHAEDAAGLLKELGNESRLMICCLLGDSELSVGELNQRLPLSQSALSQHLARLRDAGLVRTRKQSQTVFYSLVGENAVKIITTLKSIYCPNEE
ncbi:ArsR/SmtB family transcription factor [Teredinibacter waterburyi]|uniref:ArsR/SmtB family transcription factor n=1 Tax=Teredinibacter waterburyi TaxID=1500538 RepID=UPI00165FC1F7|nr:metalloregulator ArsR/SmtB family transcription factor [Teredinibacter waterburyi]